MSEAEAAIYLQLNVRTLQRYRQKGTLAYREIKGKTRSNIDYEQAELDRLKATLDAKRTQSTKPKPVPKSSVQRVTFGLPNENYAELQRDAERFGMSVGEYARRLVREGMESRFQSEATELRTKIKQLETELARTRKDFSAGFEAVLEFTGLDPTEAKQWVTENLR